MLTKSSWRMLSLAGLLLASPVLAWDGPPYAGAKDDAPYPERAATAVRADGAASGSSGATRADGAGARVSSRDSTVRHEAQCSGACCGTDMSRSAYDFYL